MDGLSRKYFADYTSIITGRIIGLRSRRLLMNFLRALRTRKDIQLHFHDDRQGQGTVQALYFACATSFFFLK